MTFLNNTDFSLRSNHFNIKDNVKVLKKLNSYSNLPVTNRLKLYDGTFGSLYGTGQEYEFSEAYRIVDTECFVAAALQKKKNLILKDGYKFLSENREDVEYIQRRLNEIEYVTETPFKLLLDNVVNSILHNHNAFLCIARKEDSSSGQVRHDGRKKLKPIAGYFFLPETRIQLIENRYNEVIGYSYKLNHQSKNLFERDDVIHFYVNRKPESNIGTPPLEAVKDDILSLRSIEESLERLIFKMSVPLLHAKVGTEDKPAGVDRITGRYETDIIAEQMMLMDEAGGITTSERVDIKMIGAENQALRLDPSLQYYKNRVLVGLTISDLDLGTGTTTTGGAASIVSEALRENIEMYQYMLEEFITDKIITPLLLEKEEYKDKQYLTDNEKVFFKFNKSNMTSKIKIESHMINELNAKVITPNEYRIATGRKPYTDEELELYFGPQDPSIVNYETLMGPDLMEAQIDNMKNPVQVTGSTSSSNSSKSTSKSKSSGYKAPPGSTQNTSNYTTPSNQHSMKIRDELLLDRYVLNIIDNRLAASTSLLSNKLYEILKDDTNLTLLDCMSFVEPLTKSISLNILDNMPINKTVSIVERVVANKLAEYLSQQSFENDHE